MAPGAVHVSTGLGQSAGGTGRCGKPVFASRGDPDYQKLVRRPERLRHQHPLVVVRDPTCHPAQPREGPAMHEQPRLALAV